MPRRLMNSLLSALLWLMFFSVWNQGKSLSNSLSSNNEILAELDNTIKECLIISLKTSEDFKLICLNYEEIRIIQDHLLGIIDNAEALFQLLSSDSEVCSEEDSIGYDVCGSN